MHPSTPRYVYRFCLTGRRDNPPGAAFRINLQQLESIRPMLEQSRCVLSVVSSIPSEVAHRDRIDPNHLDHFRKFVNHVRSFSKVDSMDEK